jgi:hypothetical protein
LDGMLCQGGGFALPELPAAYSSEENPMAQRKHELGPPMDLANMRRQGVRNLMAYCLNDACRHQAVIDVSSYPGDTLVPWFRSKVKCAKCGARHSKIDVRPNWKEAPGTIDDWRGNDAMPGSE